MGKLKKHFDSIRKSVSLNDIFYDCSIISNTKLEPDEFTAMTDFEIMLNKSRDKILAALDDVEKVFERKLNRKD